MKQGTLYIVATPIGNLTDMSQRATEILSSVSWIAAEDTRHSQHLLAHFNITTPMLAYHDHNEEQQTPNLIEKLKGGASIALISDAGTPLLSDPGYRLVKAAHESGITVSPVPGSCAAIAALSVAGLPTDRFCFSGFPPAKKHARQAFFKELSQKPETLIFYESSHRIVDSLKDLCEQFGPDRQALLARELTKTFETLRKDSLQELQDWVMRDANQQKGEFVLVIQGAETSSSDDVEVRRLLDILLDELPVKQASQIVARILGAKKNDVYKLALSMRPSD